MLCSTRPPTSRAQRRRPEHDSDTTEGEVGGAQPAERASPHGCQRLTVTHSEGATSVDRETEPCPSAAAGTSGYSERKQYFSAPLEVSPFELTFKTFKPWQVVGAEQSAATVQVLVHTSTSFSPPPCVILMH